MRIVEKKESFDEKCRRLGLFDKSIEDIIDMIAEKDKEIERLKTKMLIFMSHVDSVIQK